MVDRRSAAVFQAEKEQLAAVRGFVEAQAVAAGAAPEQVDDLVQAVDEAATNIIVHGYRGRPGTFEVEVYVEAGSLYLVLRDQAPTFNPIDAPAPKLDLPLHLRPPGGMGVYLIHQCMDEIIHRVPESGGNELILVKRLD